MTRIEPFFLLMGRAAVFWIGAGVLAALAFLMAGLSQPDEIVSPYINAAFLAAFAFPAAAGWLGGLIIQEFQHSSFAWTLPGVRTRVAGGYLAVGIAMSLLTTLIAFQAESAQNHPLVFLAVALAAYCVGGILLDPLHRGLMPVSFVLVVAFVARSQALSEVAARHPEAAVIVAAGVGLAAFFRLFARSTFRRKPFSLTKPMPGSFSVGRSELYERDRLLRAGSKKAGWREGYLGTDLWRWARAAAHESYGLVSWKTLPRALDSLWGLVLLLAVYAWADKAGLSYWESLARTIHECLLTSPHVPAFGDLGEGRGSSPIVAIYVAAAGAVLALWSASGLKSSVAYPLSRRMRARVAFRSGLLDAGIFLGVLGGALMILGHGAGWLVGYEARFDFIPFFFRALAATLVLMPLGQWGRLRLGIRTGRRDENTLVIGIFCVVGYVIAVWFWCYLSPRLFPSAPVELLVFALLFVLSQVVYRSKLRRFYAIEDLI